MATQARNYLDSALSSGGGAGTEINAICEFSNSGNYSPVNLGQLKNVAKPFYDRLAQIHYNWRTGTTGVASPMYPWTVTTGPENAAPANLGQLKNVFSFELNGTFLAADADADKIPSWWEYLYGLNPAVSNEAVDTDGDGLPDTQEYLAGLNPTTAYSNGSSGPSDSVAGLDNPDVDSDSDGLKNGDDAVPWEKNLHFKRTPECGYASIDLGPGYVAAINNRNEVAIERASTENGYPVAQIFIWKDGVLREMPLPAFTSGEAVGSAAHVVDLDHSGRLLVRRGYSTSELILFPDVAAATLTPQVLDPRKVLPADSTITASGVWRTATREYNTYTPCLLSNGKIAQIEAQWQKSNDSNWWKYSWGASMKKGSGEAYVPDTDAIGNAIGFPWLTNQDLTSQTDQVVWFLAGNRDGWGFMAQATPVPNSSVRLTNYRPVFTRPDTSKVNGVDVNKETLFAFNSDASASNWTFSPKTMAPFRQSECSSWPIMTETESLSNTDGTIGWVYNDPPVSPNKNGWTQFRFRTRPTAEKPNGDPDALASGWWNARGEFLGRNLTGNGILWRNGKSSKLNDLIGDLYPDNAVYSSYGSLAGINDYGCFPMAFSKLNSQNLYDNRNLLFVPIEAVITDVNIVTVPPKPKLTIDTYDNRSIFALAGQFNAPPENFRINLNCKLTCPLDGPLGDQAVSNFDVYLYQNILDYYSDKTFHAVSNNPAKKERRVKPFYPCLDSNWDQDGPPPTEQVLIAQPDWIPQMRSFTGKNQTKHFEMTDSPGMSVVKQWDVLRPQAGDTPQNVERLLRQVNYRIKFRDWIALQNKVTKKWIYLQYFDWQMRFDMNIPKYISGPADLPPLISPTCSVVGKGYGEGGVTPSNKIAYNEAGNSLNFTYVVLPN